MEAPAKNLRKAAILVALLDRPAADQILARFTPVEADQVRRAAENLGHVSRGERESVLQAFSAATSVGPGNSTGQFGSGFPNNPTPNHSPEDGGDRIETDNPSYSIEDEEGRVRIPSNRGVEIDDSLASLIDRYDSSSNSRKNQGAAVGSTDTPDGRSTRFGDEDQIVSFDFLEQTEPATLAGVLQCEHPQSVAVVLSSVAPSRAAELLACLPDRLQLDVLQRMSQIEPGDLESVQVLAGELRSWVENHHRNEQRRQRGITTIRNILAATGREDQAHLLRRIRKNDTALAERLGNAFRCDDTIPETSARISDQQTKTLSQNPKTPTPMKLLESVTSPEDGGGGGGYGIGLKHRRTVVGETAATIRRPEIERCATLSPVSEWIPRGKSTRSTTDDLRHFGDAEWSRIVSTVEPQLLVLALAGEGKELIDRVASHLNPTGARILRQSHESLGPIRLSDVAAARQELGRIAATITDPQSVLPLAA